MGMGQSERLGPGELVPPNAIPGAQAGSPRVEPPALRRFPQGPLARLLPVRLIAPSAKPNIRAFHLGRGMPPGRAEVGGH